jgi:sugar lactone lactonase YvrE
VVGLTRRVALWDFAGACLTRMAPDGTMLAVVDLPVSWPTCCTFGGPDLATLFVTSARFTLSEAHLAAHPEEGALVAVHSGARGRPEPRFGEGPARRC